MNGFKLQVSPEIIKAVSLHASKNDIRWYLNGVNVEVHANVAYLVATDGHSLMVARIDRKTCAVMEGQGSAIIPADALAGIKSRLDFVLEVEDTVGPNCANRYTVRMAEGGRTGNTIEGKFPDWRRVIPETVSGEVAQFSPTLLKRCQDSCSYLRSSKLKEKPFIGVGYNGDRAALIDIGREDCIVVLMPWKSDAPKASPDWAREDSAAYGRMNKEEALEDATQLVQEEAPAEGEGFTVEHLTTVVKIAA